MATPYDTIVLDEVTSTQDLATAELHRSGRPVLIVASRQTQGRGRSGNEWWQAPRGVAASLALALDGIEVRETFSLAVGLAVRRAIAGVAAIEIDLKWPNDLERNGRKVGGVLVERDERHVVVGCGINLWWPEAPFPTSALFGDDPEPAVGVAISKAWVDDLLQSGGRWDRNEYVAACTTLGAELTWDPDGRGTATTIDERGGLVVETAQGTTVLRSGEVRMIRPVRPA